jgi:hypothetical protein
MKATVGGFHGRGVETFIQEGNRSSAEVLTADDSVIQNMHREDSRFGSIKKKRTADDAVDFVFASLAG